VSALEQLCSQLQGIDGDILRMAQELGARAQQLSRTSQYVASIALSGQEENSGQALSQVASTMASASRHCQHAALALVAASREGESFVTRTVGGAGGSAGAPATTNEARAEVPAQAGATADNGALNDADERALSDYTGTGYKQINPYLRRNSNDDSHLDSRVSAVSQALSKLPTHSGIVYRGTWLSADVADSYAVGSFVTERGFTSTSSDERHAFGGNTLFLIKSKSGRVLGDHSQHRNESEVLFDHGTNFRVARNYWDPSSSQRVIVLQEV
jgi:hypothetical protein